MGLITLAFWIHGHNAQAALACTAGDGCFSCDQMRRTPSNMSMISIASISLAHSPSTRQTFSNMGPLFPLRSVMSLGIPPAVLISVWLCGNLAHSAKPPTAFVSTCINSIGSGNTHLTQVCTVMRLRFLKWVVSKFSEFWHTGWFTTCGHYCSRWFPRSLW